MPAEQTQSPARVANVPPEVTGQPRRVVVGGVTWRDTFAALKHRNYRLFFAGQFVSLIGGWMQTTAQGWHVYHPRSAECARRAKANSYQSLSVVSPGIPFNGRHCNG